MSTYLQICQKVAQESGTVPTLGEPTSVASQTGRLKRIVDWVNWAYGDIQRLSPHWRWMSADFIGATTAGTASYSASAMGIDSRFRRWITQGPHGDPMFTIYKTADGAADEGPLKMMSYDWMRRHAFIGNWLTEMSKPIYITIDPSDQLVLFPCPDDTYTIRGRYQKNEQTLSENTDVPEMPSHFHDAIHLKAMVDLLTFDEAFNQLPIYQKRYMDVLHVLKKEQLPDIEFGGPLA